jgi:DNA-binding response OmpR family regulator
MRILLVEDDSSLAGGVRTALRREGFTVNHVASGKAALEAIHVDPPELVILDLGLPDMDGLEVLRELQGLGSPPLVMVLTARNTTEDKVIGLDRGADDYLAKPFEIRELLARLRALERRTTAAQTTDLTVGPVRLDMNRHEVSVDDEEIELTRREFMLLKALMESPGVIMSRDKLESRLYGWGEELASNSIEVHIHNLRKKVPADFIRTIRGVGYTVGRR